MGADPAPSPVVDAEYSRLEPLMPLQDADYSRHLERVCYNRYWISHAPWFTSLKLALFTLYCEGYNTKVSDPLTIVADVRNCFCVTNNQAFIIHALLTCSQHLLHFANNY